MVVSRRRTGVLAVALMVALGLAACGKDDNKNDNASSSSGNNSGSSSAPGVSQKDFTNDFSAMGKLKDLAAKGKGKVAVLLPDTQSSARYVSFDAPYLKQAFEAAGLSSGDFQIQNAQGSTRTMQTQADAAITNGASVLLVDPLDSGSGAAIEKSAKDKGVAIIDYDRITLNGVASYYVSFNNVTVGKMIGQGM